MQLPTAAKAWVGVPGLWPRRRARREGVQPRPRPPRHQHGLCGVPVTASTAALTLAVILQGWLIYRLIRRVDRLESLTIIDTRKEKDPR